MARKERGDHPTSDSPLAENCAPEVAGGGEKSGLSMPGLMLAVLDYLSETDGDELQELAKEHGRENGLRVRYVDLETGKVKRLSTGPYRVRGRGYR
jgi:hypothetical protein